MMMGIMVKSILGYTFLCRENIGDETGPQGDVKVNSAQVPVCAIPQTVKNSQTALLSIPCMGQFPENFRMETSHLVNVRSRSSLVENAFSWLA